MQILFGLLVALFLVLAVKDFAIVPAGTLAGIVGILCGSTAIYWGAQILNELYEKPYCLYKQIV